MEESKDFAPLQITQKALQDMNDYEDEQVTDQNLVMHPGAIAEGSIVHLPLMDHEKQLIINDSNIVEQPEKSPQENA